MAGENEVDVDIGVSANELELQIRRTFEYMKSGLESARQLQTTFERTARSARELPAAIAEMEARLKRTRGTPAALGLPEQISTNREQLQRDVTLLEKEIQLQKELNLARQAGRRAADAAPLPDGRTVGQAKATEAALKDAITGINTTADQITARLSLATKAAMERMLNATGDAMRASLANADQRVRAQIAAQSVPGYGDARVTNTIVSAQRAVALAGRGSTLEERDANARERRQAEEENRLRTLAANRTRRDAERENAEFDRTRRAAARNEQRRAEEENRTVDANWRRMRAQADWDNRNFDMRRRASDAEYKAAQAKMYADAEAMNRQQTMDRNRQRRDAERENKERDAATKQAALGTYNQATEENRARDAQYRRDRTLAEWENRNFDLRQKAVQAEYKNAQTKLQNEAKVEDQLRSGRSADRTVRAEDAFRRRYGMELGDWQSRIGREGLDNPRQRELLREAEAGTRAARAAGSAARSTPETIAGRSFEVQQARFDLNGGADQFKMQAQLAANYAMFGAITGAITGSVSAIREFDDTLAKFQAITGAATSEMGPFREGLLGIAKDSRFSVNELAQVSIALGQTGLSVRGVLDTLKPVADLAAASGSSLEQSVQAITGVLGAYGMSATRATEVSDILVGALNRTKLTMEQVQLGIQYAANIARDSGVSFSELAATIGAIAQAGVKSGSTIGTGLRQLLTEFSNPSEKLRGVLKELGLSLQDVDLRANGLSGVLDNLQKAGFTTADALRSLDLRAANAFSAIGGQGQLIERLRQEMLLSSAAAEAAGKANESLNATLQRLQNTTFALVDRAFSPLVTALKVSTDALAGMVGGMDKLGAVLPAIGTGLTAIVATLALLKVGALAVGLLATGTGGVALGFGAAAGVGYLLAQLLSLETALGRIEKRIDVLTGLDNDVKSARDTVVTTNTDLDRQIEGLIARRQKLNDDPLQLQNEIIQAQKSYGDLGFSMEGVGKSADGLIAAYQRLREEMANKLPDLGLQQILITQEKLIALQEKQAEKARMARPRTELGAGDSVSIAEGFGFTGDPTTVDPNGRFRGLGPAFSSAMDMVANPSLIDAKDPLGSTQAVRARMVGARQQMFDQLVAEQSKPVRDQDQAAIRRFKEQLDLSGEALKVFAETAGLATEIQSNNVKLERERAQNRVDLMRTAPAVVDFDRGLRTLEADRAADQGRVLGDKSLNGRQRMDALTGALGSTSSKAKDQLARLADYREGLVSSGNDPVEVDAALAEIKGRLDQVAKNATKELRELVDVIKPEAVLVAQSERRANEAQIKALTRSAQLERDATQLRRLEENGRALIQAQDQLSRDILTFGKTPEQIASDTGLKDQLDQLNRETEAKLQRFSDDFVQRRRQIEDQALRISANVDKAREADLRAEAAKLEKIANDARTTPDKARELVEQINKLLDEAKAIATRRIDIETQREVAAAPGGPLPNYVSAPPGSVAAQIVEGARGAGRGDMVNYLLGLGTMESGLKPNAANKSGAKGLFQFMNNEYEGGVNTWGKYGKGSIWDVQNQVNAAIDFTRDNDNLFRQRLGRDPTDPERFVLHNQGGAGGTRLLRNPNDLARNYVSAAAIENNGAKGRSGTITAGEFTEILKGMYEAAARGAKGYTTDAKTVLGQKAEADTGKVAEADEAERRRLGSIVPRKEDVALLAGLKLEDKTDTAQIAAALTKLASAGEVGTVVQGSSGITAGYGRLRARAIQEDGLDLNNRSRTPEQKAEAEGDITERFRALAERGALAASDAAGRVSTRLMDQEIARAEARLKALQLDRNENKVDQATVDAEAQRLSNLKERRGLEGENEAIKAQILVLEKALTDATAAGLGPAEKQVAINEKLVELKRRAAISDEQVGLGKTLRETAPSMDNAISGAINDFEKSRGIRDPLGNIVNSTQEARKLLAAELQVIGNGFDNLFTNLFSGSMKAGDALKKFATDVLGGLMSQLSKSLTNDLFKAILPSKGGAGGGILDGIMSIFKTGATAAYLGGPIRMAGGGAVPGTDAALRDRDSKLILAQPGEFLLRKSAVDAIGGDTLSQVNALGGKMAARAPAMSVPRAGSSAQATTSVYVVAPDQVPPPGQDQIVYYVADNMNRGGALAQLVKQITVRG